MRKDFHYKGELNCDIAGYVLCCTMFIILRIKNLDNEMKKFSKGRRHYIVAFSMTSLV